MKVLIFTNARLITAELAALLARIPPLEKMEITVYGMSAKSYEAVSRAKGTLDTPIEYLCEVAHAQARKLGLLGEDEKSWNVTDAPARVSRLDSLAPQAASVSLAGDPR